MASATEHGSTDARYTFRFVVAAFLLVSITLVLVLFVLPERYVLESGFQESGLVFPDARTPFLPPDPVRVAARPGAAAAAMAAGEHVATSSSPGGERPPELAARTDAAARPTGRGPAELFWERVLPLLESRRWDEALPLFEPYLAEHPGDRGVRTELARTLVAAHREEDAVPVLEALLHAQHDPAARLLLARTLRDLGRAEEAYAQYEILAAAAPDDEALALEWAQAVAWLTPPELELDWPVEPAGEPLNPGASPPEPTLLEQAVAAREADDFDEAARLFESALAAEPDAPDVWRAYADFLEYELGDFERAERALLEVERLGAADADVHARLGDLRRWEGARVDAGDRYERALAADPDNARAGEGMRALLDDIARTIEELENPRVGTSAYGLADTDDFELVDLGGAWVEVNDRWVWAGAAGSRWVGGHDPAGSLEREQGFFVDVGPARWWRWGTIRTSLHFGAQWVRPGEADLSFGAGLRYRNPGGTTIDVAYRHEPGYTFASTLQSLRAELSLDRVQARLEAPLGDRWSVSAQADVALLEPAALPDEDASTRLQAAVAVARSMGGGWSLGWSAQAATYTDAAPDVGGQRLYWDPSAALVTGPYARLAGPLSEAWAGSLRLGAGLAVIDERGDDGFEQVPQLSAEAGLEYSGARVRTSVDVFYSQARLEGYRLYGIRLALSPGGG